METLAREMQEVTRESQLNWPVLRWNMVEQENSAEVS